MPVTEKILLHTNGPALWPERYDEKSLIAIRHTVGEYFWAALFCGLPRPKGGLVFKPEWFPLVDSAPTDAQRVRFWDKAASEGKGDWTVGVLMARDRSGRYTIENVVRERLSSARRDARIIGTSDADRELHPSYMIRGEQEPGSSGKDAAVAFVAMLAGFDVKCSTVTGDKPTRARPLASQAEGGNVSIVRAGWNKTFLQELEDFPRGKHDDQVDAASGAFNALAGRNNQAHFAPSPLALYDGRIATEAAPKLRAARRRYAG